METKQRFITMFIALVAMFMGTKVMAQEAYAVLSDDGKTLTFRYDSSKSSYGNKAYYLNEGNNLPGWNGITTVETVVFEESFATARPVSTRSWFDCFKDLTEIVGMEYLNTSEVTTMNSMFGGCKSITNLDLSHFNTSKVTNMEAMFNTCHKLKEINLRGFDTSNVTSMQIMFKGCDVLETLNLGSFNTSNATSMGMMFDNCCMLKTIYVGDGWSVANASCFGMFTGCVNLTGGEGTTYDAAHQAADYAHIDGLNGKPGYLSLPPEAYAVYNRSSDNVSTLTFYYDNLRNTIQRVGIKKYDLNEEDVEPGWISDNRYIEKVVFDESFKDARPTTTDHWFYELNAVESFTGLEYLNTSEVTDMNFMFYGCSSLETLTLGDNFDTSNVTAMGMMFYGCSSLETLTLGNRFDTSRVTSMHSMFSDCRNLETLNLSSFNTSNVVYMMEMFYLCENLKTITVGENWKTANVESSSNMFSGCTSLVGGAGTSYNSGKVDKEYARIDGGTSNPGYLTALTYNLKLAGVRVTAANQNNVLGNGIFTYVPSSKTLKVKGSYSSSLDAPLIESHIDGLIIDVMQDAVLEASSTHGNQVFWLKDGTTTMKGKGKLTLKSLYETGIYLTNSASVVIDNMNMVIDAYWGIAGPPPSGQKQEKLTIKSSNIVITTGSSTSNGLAAICDLQGGIILQDCSITSPNGYNISNGSVYNNGKLAREVTITVDGGITTDIDAIDNGQLTIDKSLPLYNLNGQRVSHPVKGQIYIQNGRKIKFR